MSLPEILRDADALRQRWRPDATLIGEPDLVVAPRRLRREYVARIWGHFAEHAPPWARERVSLYLHALLCPTRCSYCHCVARQPRSKDEREQVLGDLAGALALEGRRLGCTEGELVELLRRKLREQ